ncbi:hypothetical protein KK083_20230 [Fulvivirgaceae bacterium PWU4]|uniref:RHS repeat protein n=1 Tax=Chryseosolibacter histidini TaxID=2782349 RepID=A0AAP2DMY1_9BACT|nr:hypothetical protein [Chryseosolibacter histidini]MBT1699236.1 hypothetical protein [Chryseosolibacter histidini]
MSKYCFILLALSCIVGTLKAQGTDPVQHAANMLPPSPTASELGKYGLVPVGLSTGTPNVEIPLHTFTSRYLSVPISLSYNANGIKVDQIATWVGMAWSLNAGGVVTRTIRDEADQPDPVPYPENFSQTNPEGIKYLEYAGNNDSFDSEPDLYAFNFMGYSGKFIYDRSGTPIVMPHQNIKIERVMDSSPTNGYFMITTPDGIKYTFGAPERSKSYSIGCGKTFDNLKETSWYLTSIEHPAGDVIHFEYEGTTSTNTVEYYYAASITQSVMKKIGEEAGCEASASGCAEFETQTCKTVLLVRGVRLKRIYASNFGEVEFLATKDRLDLDDYKLNEIKVKDNSGALAKSFQFSYTFATAATGYGNELTNLDDEPQLARRMFLTGLSEKSKTGIIEKTHGFEYDDMNGLPVRLSYAQDHWGYFNGAHNTYFVPVDKQRIEDQNGRKVFENIGGNREANSAFSTKGLLKKITYPTGGSSELFFEPNTYWDYATVTPPPTPIDLSISAQSNHQVMTSMDLLNIYEQEIQITTRAIHNANYEEGDDDQDQTHYKVQVSVIDITTDNPVYNNYDIQLGTVATAYIKLAKDHRYRIILMASGRIVKGILSSAYINELPSTMQMNLETGGLRVSKIKNYDPVTSKFEETNYTYAKVGTSSSGVARSIPQYYGRSSILTTIQCTGTNGSFDRQKFCYYGTLYSSSQSTLYPVNGNNVYYQYVVVSRGSNHTYGAEEHEFMVQFDAPGAQVWGDEDILSAPYTNLGWSNGLEKSAKYFKRSGKSLVLIKQIDNHYVTDIRNEKETKGLVVRKKYNPVYTMESTIPCNAENRTKTYGRYTCLNENEDHFHIWLIGGIPFFGNGKIKCIAPNAINGIRETSQHPCYQKNVESVAVPMALDYLDAIEYRNIAYWFYMDYSTETNYDENGQNPVTTKREFFYDNPGHAQLSRIKTQRSDGRYAESAMKYVDDYTAFQNLAALQEKHIVNVPIKTENSVDGMLTDGQVIQLNDKGQALEVYQYESAILKASPVHNGAQLIPSADYKLKATLTYDASANVSEVQTTNQPKISYKWGHSATRVIAKISGAAAADVFHTSFEEDGVAGAARTGERFLNSGTYTITTQAFNPVSTTGLVLSYWYWNNNQWVYSGELPFTRNITAGTRLDEIRVYPKGSQLTTITYNTLYNTVKTMTDHNNITTSYEYDNLGRLLRVRDDKQNIVTEQKYHFYNNTSNE